MIRSIFCLPRYHRQWSGHFPANTRPGSLFSSLPQRCPHCPAGVLLLPIPESVQVLEFCYGSVSLLSVRVCSRHLRGGAELPSSFGAPGRLRGRGAWDPRGLGHRRPPPPPSPARPGHGSCRREGCGAAGRAADRRGGRPAAAGAEQGGPCGPVLPHLPFLSSLPTGGQSRGGGFEPVHLGEGHSDLDPGRPRPSL